jgi:diguanylate cyclase (GGDEF)-like protein/PAS domain S-box-containing protein
MRRVSMMKRGRSEAKVAAAAGSGDALRALFTARALHGCARALLRVRTEPELARALCDGLAGAGAYGDAGVAFPHLYGQSSDGAFFYAGSNREWMVAPERYWKAPAQQEALARVREHSAAWLAADGTELALPLRAFGACVGVLSVRTFGRRALDAEEVQGLTELAEDASDALEGLRERVARGVPEQRSGAERAPAGERFVLHTIIDALPHHVYFKDRWGRFTHANAAWLAARRLSLDQVVGRTVHDVFPPALARQMEAQDIHVMTTGLPLVEREQPMVVTEADGTLTPAWGATTKVALRNARGEITGLVGISRDITEARRIDRALRSYVERFEMAARATNDAVWDWDIASDNFWWGEGFERLFLYRRDEVEPGLASWTLRVHPDEREAVTAGMYRAIEQGETFWSAEYRFRRADGRYALVYDRGYILRDEQGHAVRMVGAMADVTEPRSAELQRNMEHAVARLLAESRSVEETMPRLMRTMCEAMSWAYAAWWRWDAAAARLVRAAWWCAFEPDFDDAERVHWTGPGDASAGPEGVVRWAWLQERATWIRDIDAAPDFARSPSALRLGFQSTCAFPVIAHGERLGVIEFFGREVLEPNEGLLQATVAVASQIGQFVRRKQAEESLQESEQQLSAMFESADVGISLWGLDLRYRRVNDCYCRIVGYSREELAQMSVAEVNLEENRASLLEMCGSLLAGSGSSVRTEKQLVRKDGTLVWVSMAMSLVRGSDRGPRYFIAILQDVSESKRAAAALEESEELFRQLAGNIPQVFWIADATLTRTIYISPACERLLGLSQDLFVGDRKRLIKTVHPDDRRRVYQARRNAACGSYNETYRIIRPDGSVRWVQDRAFPVRDRQGVIYRIAGIAEDVTDRKRAEEQLVELAHYDVVTKLPNRALLYDRLAHGIARARRSGSVLAVLFIDVDRFKHVNDTFGHAAGDELLKRVSERLSECIRAEDTVGRLSGDEFAIVLSQLVAAEDAALVAKKVLAAFNRSFQIEGAEVYVTVSIGITVFPTDSVDQDTLLRNADVAMYRAKELGRNNYQFYTPEMNRRTREMLNMEGELRRALERGELVAHYQPKVSLATGRITGVEALMRWRHPERGLISPADFMPLLEETGLIVQAGERIMRAVCRQLRDWIAAGVRPVPVAINLSARQFVAPDLAASIGRILEEHGVPAELVELEITESSIMSNTEEAIRTLERLQTMGLAIAVDDFGTGYSSLSYLKRFPLRALKIDRSFVRDMTSDPDDATITQAVISMAHSLALKVVAEGVETEAQLALLARYGCDEVQGYLFSRPVPGSECGSMLAENRPYAAAVPVGALEH